MTPGNVSSMYPVYRRSGAPRPRKGPDSQFRSWPDPCLSLDWTVRHANRTRTKRMIMMKNFARLLTITLLLSAARNSSADCGQLSATLTNLPALNNSGFQVNGLNSAGQLTGFFFIAGVHAGHAFVYSDC